MSIFEYNEEAEMKKLRKSEFQHGEQVGEQKGMERGLRKGLEKGIEKGEHFFIELSSRLLSESRMEDLQKAMTDSAYRKALYHEYGIGVVNEEPSEYQITKE